VFGMFNSLLKINSYSIYPHFEEIIDILYALVNEDRLETYTYQFFSALLDQQVQYFEDAIVSQVNDLQSLKILAPHIKNNIARIVRLCALNIIFQEKINSPKSTVIQSISLNHYLSFLTDDTEEKLLFLRKSLICITSNTPEQLPREMNSLSDIKWFLKKNYRLDNQCETTYPSRLLLCRSGAIYQHKNGWALLPALQFES